MCEFIIFLLAVVFVCLGITEAIHIFRMRFIKPDSEFKTFYIVMLDGKDAVNQLEFTAQHLNWTGENYAQYKIAVYENLSEPDEKYCSEIAEKYGIFCCRKGEEKQIVKSLL